MAESATGATTSTAAERGRFFRDAVIVFVAIVVVDQLTKWWAESRLETGACTPATCIDIFGSPVRFHLHYNTGAAFSQGRGFGLPLGLLAIAMTGYLLSLAYRSSDRRSALLFGAIGGGAIGNVIDRVFRADDGFMSGGVVDFIDFQFFPIFNIADSAIVLGVIGMFVLSIAAGPEGDPVEGDPAEDSASADASVVTDGEPNR